MIGEKPEPLFQVHKDCAAYLLKRDGEDRFSVILEAPEILGCEGVLRTQRSVIDAYFKRAVPVDTHVFEHEHFAKGHPIKRAYMRELVVMNGIYAKEAVLVLAAAEVKNYGAKIYFDQAMLDSLPERTITKLGATS